MVNSSKWLAPAHLLLYSVVFGSTTYQSFFAGIVSFRALDRANFSALQAKVFPVYFPGQAVGSALLLLSAPFALSLRGRWSLGVALATSALNTFWLGPLNTRLVLAREARAREEGIESRDPNGSDELKHLNKQFAQAHGVSVLANLGTFFSLASYGLILAAHIV